jgi:alkylation response protein AidB-like acyl-CoA dehydrogenase
VTSSVAHYGIGVQGEDAAETKRLLDAVDEIAGVLVAGAARSDIEGRLGEETVDALRSHDLWKMRLCHELGGLELPIVSQIQVLASLAAVDTSSAWCTMVANSSVAVLGATMPVETVDRVFAHGVPACSIVAAPGGTAVRQDDGGYMLAGTWRLASSVHHADWIHATAYVDGDPSRLLPMAIPARDVELIDSWRVVGLSGTGSNDFSLHDYLLDQALAGREVNPFGQLRGRRRYDLVGLDNIESYEHLAFALGVGRRALRELRHALAHPAPGRHVGDREVVQSELGRATIKLQAIETAAADLYGRIDAAALGGGQQLSDADPGVPRALATWATEVALECVQLTFRRSGVAALQRPNILEKLLRDMSVAATHFLVNDTAFAAYAEYLIEAAGVDPLTGGDRAG